MAEHINKVVQLKNRMLDVSFKNQKGFLASSFSIMDILVCLYYEIMHECDEFILSKGHAAFGLYAVLEDIGRLKDNELDTFGMYGSRLSLMADGNRIPDILFSTGSLGIGLSEAVGVAYAKKIKKEEGRVFTIIGDGEMNEGSIWEAIITSVHLNLNNLVCIIDYNVSSNIWVEEVFFEDMLPKGICVKKINGHDDNEIRNILMSDNAENKPMVIIAKTVKGKGCKSIEDAPGLWHSKAPNENEYKILKQELYG